MENDELQRLVEEISLHFFSMPFLHKAIFNSRLKTTGGRYLTKTHHLEFNPKSYEQYGLDELIGIIKHELCHYHMHLQGKGYKHKDQDFKQCLKKIGGSRFAKQLSKQKEQPYRFLLECRTCGQQYFRKKKMNPDRYRCGKCGGKLKGSEIDYQK
ncbi:MAG: SprT family protein [Tepidibacillus sp.]